MSTGLRPQRTFSADVGEASTGTAGPDQIEYDIDVINKMFNPATTHADGTTGGIGTNNMQSASATDDIIGDRTIDDSIADEYANTGKPTVLLSMFAKVLKTAFGGASWHDIPKNLTNINVSSTEITLTYEDNSTKTYEITRNADSKISQFKNNSTGETINMTWT